MRGCILHGGPGRTLLFTWPRANLTGMWMRQVFASLPITGCLALAMAPACGASDPHGLGAGSTPDSGGTGVILPDAEAFSDAAPAPIGAITGKVVAPEGTIPIAGALVYLTRNEPGPLPTRVYCDKCVRVDSHAFTYSAPDGSFRLPVHAEGAQFIVTQKGQFRRVRRVDVARGDQRVNADDTRLPGRNDAVNGDTIPKMKVMMANWDAIANSLRKLGVVEFDAPPPVTFPPTFPPTIPPPDNTLTDANLLGNYHIVFIPCSGSSAGEPGASVACTWIYAPTGEGKRIMKEFIKAGGKLYVTDWSYEYVNQTWPGFVQFQSQGGTGIGSACTVGAYSGAARWDDPSLGQWMSAIGEGNAQLEKSYVRIESTRAQQGVDEEGRAATITPKVWASSVVDGNPRIATVSFQDGCGRVLYSTYHAEGTDSGGSNTLLAQEKALFHILLEVATCVGIKPEPPR